MPGSRSVEPSRQAQQKPALNLERGTTSATGGVVDGHRSPTRINVPTATSAKQDNMLRRSNISGGMLPANTCRGGVRSSANGMKGRQRRSVTAEPAAASGAK